MVQYDGTSPTGDVAGDQGRRQGVGRWSLAAAAGWLSLGLACVALAVLEHERSRAAVTGTSVLCGSLLSCSDGLDKRPISQSRGARIQRTQSLEEENKEEENTGEENKGKKAVDGFDLFSFGGEAQDASEPSEYFSRYQRPGDVPNDVPSKPASFKPVDAIAGTDTYVPFYEEPSLLLPGDVPHDEPSRHHEKGFYNFFGLLADKEENLLTSEITDQACCVCIPGAPDYRDPTVYGGEVNGNVIRKITDGITGAFWGAEQGIVDGAGAIEKGTEGAIGVVGDTAKKGVGAVGGAFTASKPTEVGAAGAAGAAGVDVGTVGKDAPIVEAFPFVEAEPTAAPAGRRLLAEKRPGYNAKAHIQALDGYMLVHVPESAAPGDTFKAKTPSGHIWAFKVPENLPKDRIIKLHLPDLKASKGAATLKSAKGMSLAHAKRHAHSRVAASIAAARAAGHMAYTAGRMLEGEDAAAAVAPISNATNSTTETQEPADVPANPSGIGFGPGLIPPHAGFSEACCMCPLYNQETGEIEGWIADAPADPVAASANYVVVAQAIAARNVMVDNLVHSKAMDPSWLNPRFSWQARAEEPEAVNVTNATNATDIQATGEAVMGVISNIGNLKAHRVTHLHQRKGPIVHAVNKAVAQKAARPVGKPSPLQVAVAQIKAKTAERKPTVVSTRTGSPAVVAAAALARGQLPEAVQAMPQVAQETQQPGASMRPAVEEQVAVSHAAQEQAQQQAKHVEQEVAAVLHAPASELTHAIKTAPVAVRQGPAEMEPVQAVAVPMSRAIAAEKPVQAFAEPVAAPLRAV